MKFATLVKGLAVAAVLSSTSLVSSVSFANSPVNGVSCPSGFNSSFSGGVLKCEKDVTSPLEVRAAVCPFGTVNYTTIRNGRDFCVDAFGSRKNAVPALVLDPQNWRLDQDGAGGGQDRFLKGGITQHQFAYAQEL